MFLIARPLTCAAASITRHTESPVDDTVSPNCANSPPFAKPGRAADASPIPYRRNAQLPHMMQTCFITIYIGRFVCSVHCIKEYPANHEVVVECLVHIKPGTVAYSIRVHRMQHSFLGSLVVVQSFSADSQVAEGSVLLRKPQFHM